MNIGEIYGELLNISVSISSLKMSSHPLTSFQKEQRTKLIDKLLATHIGPIFRKLDPNAIPGYTDIVSRPMDLEKVKYRLNHKPEYSEKQFQKEMQLIFDNCRAFNGKETPYGLAASELENVYKKKMKKLTPTPEAQWLKDIETVSSKLKKMTKRHCDCILEMKSEKHHSK
ncbi:Bromodomain containing protein [Tritrichomonas foetus]|uniref:Bromodomain containing protein n=1 Tax=Tritrichomonas foetus TaxID=1144522 RepID=A0A1J4JVZ2_9EUKA|nr:Bromodomain containing protein [Tritrichomonas foetus]|eukprot:OHT03179.1 Bromodomain containing protein [Tritrichomonas foetus]